MDEIPLEGYKVHQAEGDQFAYKGIALNPIEEANTLKINEIVKLINKFMPSVKLLDMVGTGLASDLSLGASVEPCCQEDGTISPDELKKSKGECLHDESEA